MADNRPLRGGMVGAGGWSEVQLRAWSLVEEAEIVALCDRHPDRRDPVADQFAISAVYDDLDTMLETEELDFVDICVRPYSHSALVRTVADRGLPVLCQKPFCRTLEEARETVEYCERKGVRLMINENYRWQSRYRRAKEVLDGGQLGRPFAAHIHTRNDFARPPFTSKQAYFAEMERLIVYEMGVHYFDTLRYLFGNPTAVYARTHRVSPAMHGEDTMILVVSYPELTALVQVGWASFPSEPVKRCPVLTIEGTHGTLAVTSDDQLWLDTEQGHVRERLRSTREKPFAADTQRHFVECLRTGRDIETSGRYYLATMELVYACYESVATARAVEMSYQES